MKLIVGLGNPGEEYINSRHNIGFNFLDAISAKFDLQYKVSGPAKAHYTWVDVFGERVELFKPLTFMNNSGITVAYAKKQHPDLEFSDICIIHDDLDLPLGEYKIQLGVGPKEHNGINDIEEKIKSKDFWRVRIGIDNRDSKARVPGEDYVLQRFNKEELELLQTKVFPRIVEDLLTLLHNDK